MKKVGIALFVWRLTPKILVALEPRVRTYSIGDAWKSASDHILIARKIITRIVCRVHCVALTLIRYSCVVSFTFFFYALLKLK